MKVLMKDYKGFNDKLKSIDNDFNVDIQYWVIYGKPAVRKIHRVGDEFVELAVYYNYRKELVSKITKNRVISESDNCTMSSPFETITEDFEIVKQASKNNILAKVEQLKNIDLKQYI